MSSPSLVYRFGDIRVEPYSARVYRGDRPVAVEPKAFDVLRFLVENPGRLVEKQELLDAVWRDTAVTENAMTRVVAQLRKTLGDDAKQARYIETVPTRGYRFIAEVVTENGDRAGVEARRARVPRYVAWLALLGGLASGIAATLLVTPAPDPGGEFRRAALPLGGPSIDGGWTSVFDLSPRGDRFVFVGRESSSPRRRLYVRSLDSDSVRPLPGTEDAVGPFFSPDGETVAFFREDRLMRVPLSGGAPETIVTASASSMSWPPKIRGDWHAPDEILLALVAGTETLKLEAVSLRGDRRALAELPLASSRYVTWVDVLPDRRKALLSTRTGPNPEDSWLELLDLETGGRAQVASGYHGVVTETGHLLYVSSGALLAAPLDPERGEIGRAEILVDGVLSDPLIGTAQFAISKEGTLAYLPPIQNARLTLAWTDRAGQSTVASAAPFRFLSPALSPDGRRVAFRHMASDDARALWLLELETGASRRVPIEGNPVAFVWSPDGSAVAFAWERGGPFNLYSMPLAGNGDPERLTESPRRQFPKSFSPDGRLLVYEEENVLEGPRDIWLLELEGGHAKKSRPFLTTPADEKEPSFSPDGKFLVFQTNASGRSEIEIASVATGQRFRVSTEGGREPLWTRGGREIVYRSGTQFFAVSVTPSEAPELSYPTALFDSGFLAHGYRNYDVTPDGERFLGVRLEGLEPYDTVQLALNWPRKLSR
jgi:Tol biopolymer transport system component/DNA-binding winged helix-turn-helix (wHTH) protein